MNEPGANEDLFPIILVCIICIISNLEFNWRLGWKFLDRMRLGNSKGSKEKCKIRKLIKVTNYIEFWRDYVVLFKCNYFRNGLRTSKYAFNLVNSILDGSILRP